MTIKATKDTGLKLRVDIRPGPVSPAQKTAWRKFWQKLIAEVKSEAKNG